MMPQKLLVVLIAGWLALASFFAPARAVADQKSLQTELRAITEARFAAALAGDRRAWRKNVDRRFLWTEASVQTLNRSQLEDAVFTNATPRRVELQDFKVTGSDATAVATYLQIFHQGDSNTPAQKMRRTDTFQRRRGQWILISSAEMILPGAHQAVDVPSSVLERLAGRYEDAKGRGFVIRFAGGQAVIERPGQAEAELKPLAASLFFVPDENWQIIFPCAGEEPPSQALIQEDGVDLRLTRRP